ncbi:MAG: hypothetical protein K2K75_09895 [Muribaculaceae bacterium]|nr:hypothetical protein [Muribaculaceae bacterium]
MKSLLKLIAIVYVLLPLKSQAQKVYDEDYPNRIKDLAENMNKHGVLNSIEIAANIGTTGLGLEVASPITKWTKLRVGFDWMPQFTVPMNFGLSSYVDGKVNEKFDRIQEMMYKISGMKIDQEIRMESKPTMTTFRLLVDVYPFKNNRHWHFTTGFFVGGTAVGKSINKITEMPSLLALNMYNRIYNEITSDDFYDNAVDNPNYLADLTGIASLKGTYLDQRVIDELQDKMFSMGKLGVHIGDYGYDEDDEPIPYMMQPDKDGTVSAKAIVNKFRPYLGFGYGGALSADGKWEASFDAGVQFWGGVPKVTTHDGTVLNDLINLRGKVGTYMDLMKAIPVYPTIDFRISYRF